MKTKVIEKAVQKFQKSNVKDRDYTVKDALVYALEEYDTGYDLLQEDWINLENEIAAQCK